MIEIDRYQPDDRDAVDGLYRSVLGDERTESLARRWDWLYRRNPNLPDPLPLLWLARDGAAVIGHLATVPVRLSVNGTEIAAAWGTDAMVAPQRQRQGLGERLCRTWDSNVGAALALSLTDASHGLFEKMGWPELARIPRFAKPLSRHTLNIWRTPHWRIAAFRLPWDRMIARLRPLDGELRLVRSFDASFTRLWERVAPRFAFSVRRDAAYLEWKYGQAPHVEYSRVALVRDGETAGYAVYRHVDEPRWRVTLLVDFLADPADPSALMTLLRWVDREAIAAGSDLIRVLSTNRSYREVLQSSGYYASEPTMRFIAKINGVNVPPTFYDSCDDWHVTMGDSDVDR